MIPWLWSPGLCSSAMWPQIWVNCQEDNLKFKILSAVLPVYVAAEAVTTQDMALVEAVVSSGHWDSWWPQPLQQFVHQQVTSLTNEQRQLFHSQWISLPLSGLPHWYSDHCHPCCCLSHPAGGATASQPQWPRSNPDVGCCLSFLRVLLFLLPYQKHAPW